MGYWTEPVEVERWLLYGLLFVALCSLISGALRLFLWIVGAE
jgi:hypothetical protein